MGMTDVDETFHLEFIIFIWADTPFVELKWR
jgi:hypothetical protein